MGNTSSTNYKAQDNDEFVIVETYSGETKDGKKHGQGIYLFPNGDIYDGEWRKSKKCGQGVYIFADDGTGKTKSKRQDGFFYKDEYIGNKPNEKIIKRMQKKQRLLDRGGVPTTEQTDLSNDDVLEDHQSPRLKSEGLRSRARTGYYMKRSFNYGDKRTYNKAEVAKQRREEKRLRETIRAKYSLPSPRTEHGHDNI